MITLKDGTTIVDKALESRESLITYLLTAPRSDSRGRGMSQKELNLLWNAAIIIANQREVRETKWGDKLLEIKERWTGITPGPWYWDVSTYNRSVRLMSNTSGLPLVMGLARWGMQGAAPEFCVKEKPTSRCGNIVPIDEIIKPRVSHHPDFNMDIIHPDAQAIAHAPEDITFLLGLIDRLHDIQAQRVSQIDEQFR